MRKLILSMQTSLDGYVEGKNGDMSWMQPDDNATWADLFDMLKDKVDLFLLGRGMWTEYRNYWIKALAEPEKFSANEVEYAKLAEKTQHIVFSKTLREAGWQNTTINNGDLETEIKKIKHRMERISRLLAGLVLQPPCWIRGWWTKFACW